MSDTPTFHPLTPHYYLGVDPGVTGAIALLYGGPKNDMQLVEVHDMPVKNSGHKTYKERMIVDPRGLLDLIGHLVDEYDPLKVYVEGSQAAPGQSASSAFNYGVSYGKVLTALEAYSLDVQIVAPVTWKRLIGLTGADKLKSLHTARAQWPDQSHLFDRRKDHGRAEASIIGALGGAGVFA